MKILTKLLSIHLTWIGLFLFSSTLLSAQDTFRIAKKDSLTSVPEAEPLVFRIVEEMPRWHSCAESKNNDCTQREIMRFLTINAKIDTEIDYPSTISYISFIIDTSGKVVDVTPLKRGPDDPLNQLAVGLISTMPDFIPGKQRGQPVLVQMTIPFRIQIR